MLEELTVGKDISYASLFTDSRVPMLLIDFETGNIIKANLAAVEFYGYSLQHLQKLKIQNINQLSADEVKQEMQRAKNLNQNHFLFKHKLACGDIRDVEVFASPVNFNNRKLLFSVIHDVTVRIQAEKQINLYAQLFTSTNDFLAVINNDKVYLAANQHYLNMLGKTPSEVIGHTVSQVVGEKMDLSYSRYVNKALKGDTVCYERIQLTPENRKINLEIRYFPFIDKNQTQKGVVAVMRDVSEQRRHREQQSLSSAVFESTSEGILVINKHGMVMDANAALVSLSGYHKFELINHPFDSLFVDSELHQVLPAMPSFNSWSGEVYLKTKQQTLISTSITFNRVIGKTGAEQSYVCLVRDITYYKETEAKLSDMAHHDHLTGLANRLTLGERLQEHLCRANRYDTLTYVVFMDLDNFKSVNDNYGHPTGDALLMEVADRLRQVIRSTDTIARVSGDEFVAVIESAKDANEIEPILKRLMYTFNQPFFIDGHRIITTLSIGVSQFPDNGLGAEDLISMADSAMYVSKKNGKNQITYYGSANPPD
ncbi:diguanylate cyclase domain-containing protein [Vibrio sp. HN007]|uniref:sensor domain-containing protein n=1 Tax=Vibrio iocasae TaxID=3098914 RepID=UPI0035D43B60